VGRSVALSSIVYFVLVLLYRRDAVLSKAWSLLKRKERFIGETAQEAMRCTELQWRRQWRQVKHGAGCLHHDPSLLRYISLDSLLPLSLSRFTVYGMLCLH
jgi:hypothetical protein